jgi:hypothetical protein
MGFIWLVGKQTVIPGKPAVAAGSRGNVTRTSILVDSWFASKTLTPENGRNPPSARGGRRTVGTKRTF